MNKLVKILRIVFNISGGVFSGIAILLLIISITISSKNNQFYDSAKSTTGQVELVSYNDSYTVIEYKVDGKVYDKQFTAQSSNVYTGKEVTVYYNPDNPQDSKIKEFSGIVNFILNIIGGVFLFIGIMEILIINIICHVYLKKKEEKQKVAF